MKLRHPWFRRLAGFAVATTARNLLSTVDYRGAYYDPCVDPASPPPEPCVYLEWHEYLSLTIDRRPRRNCAVLVSGHSDGEIVRAALELSGYETITGSSKRGGATAMREFMQHARQGGHITISPDGPRGPRRKMSLGAIFLASKLGLPLVCIGHGCDRPWRFNSWDKLAVPRPFSRVRIVMGPRTYLPTKLDREGLEFERQRIEDQMIQITQVAEDWADSGERMRNEFAFLPWSQLSRRFQRLRRVTPLEHLAGMRTEVAPYVLPMRTQPTPAPMPAVARAA